MYNQFWTCDNCGWGTFNSTELRKVLGATIEAMETGAREQICQTCYELIRQAERHNPVPAISDPTYPVGLTVEEYEQNRTAA